MTTVRAAMDIAAVIDETQVTRVTGDGLFCPPTAVFDLTGQYRYELGRTWSDGPLWTWLMLNPSTADAFKDDPTIGRCVEFARTGGAAGVIVVNLFAYRATKPAALSNATDPVGALNDAFILNACPPSRRVIAAWGVHGHLGGRAAAVTAMLAAAGVHLECLGTTKEGCPRHPLYVPGIIDLIPYEPVAA